MSCWKMSGVVEVDAIRGRYLRTLFPVVLSGNPVANSGPSGGKFTIRLLHPATPVLYEALLFALIGDQFDEADNVVGCVLSVRQTEDILSVWVEEEGEGVRSGALR